MVPHRTPPQSSLKAGKRFFRLLFTLSKPKQPENAKQTKPPPDHAPTAV